MGVAAEAVALVGVQTAMSAPGHEAVAGSAAVVAVAAFAVTAAVAVAVVVGSSLGPEECRFGHGLAVWRSPESEVAPPTGIWMGRPALATWPASSSQAGPLLPLFFALPPVGVHPPKVFRIQLRRRQRHLL